MKPIGIRTRIEQSPVVWLLSTLLVGFASGTSAMLALQTYCGMVMITKGEYRELVSTITMLRRRVAQNAAAGDGSVLLNCAQQPETPMARAK